MGSWTKATFFDSHQVFLSRAHLLAEDENGDAAVEAVIIFPIMIMIIAALVLLAVYLPTRAALQRATQYAATALATEISDTWMVFDEGTLSYARKTQKDQLDNVYVAMFSGLTGFQRRGEEIVAGIESRSLSSKAGVLDVECFLLNRIVYKEVIVTAERRFSPPVDLSFIRFPTLISVKVTSTAVVQNSDEFVRNMDLADEFAKYVIKKFNLTSLTEALDSIGGTVSKFFGW